MNSLVVLRAGADRSAFIDWLRGSGLSFTEFPAIPRMFSVRGFTSHPDVESVEPGDEKIKGASQDILIDEDLVGGAWGLARMIRRAPPWSTAPLGFPVNTFYRCARDGDGVDLYVFDTGIRASHEEFGGRASNVYEAVSSGGSGDDQGHGTATSSTAAGATVGPARGALIWGFKCLDSNNSGTIAYLVACLNEALLHYQSRFDLGRPAVANLSLAYDSTSPALTAGVSALIDAGMVVVAAAANDGLDLGEIQRFPAESDPDVIVAGATGPADIPLYQPPTVTNWGDRVDVSAPGQVMRSAAHSGDSDYGDHRLGTSFSCPSVAGAIACMLQGHPRLSGRAQVRAVREHVMSTATIGMIRNPPGWGVDLPDRLLYLDPDTSAPEDIPGL